MATQGGNIRALAANLTTQLDDLRKELDSLKTDMNANNDAFFNCAMALIIFLMQCGFAFLEAGAVRSKNCTNIIIKNLLDSLLSIIAYSALGWALAYGTNPSPALDPFFGFSQFGLVGTDNFAKFFFQFVFCATASTIVSGAIAERGEFALFLTYSLMISGFVYPVLTHWGWSPNGWMIQGFAVGDQRTTYIDFAGSGMVHICGGTISLIAAVLIGPRIGRFPERTVRMPLDGAVRKQKEPKSMEIKGHSVPFASLGGFILMFGFLAFNGGSTGEISSVGVGQTVAKAMVNTILCGAFAALSYLFVHFFRKGKWTILLTINACLTGMVTACAGCNQMHAWTCMIAGSGAGMAYLFFAELALAFKVDDPLDAFAVHFGGGFWGLISATLITEKGLLYVWVGSANVPLNLGLWQILWQFACAVAIVLWCALTMTPAFLILKAIGKMRVPREVEIRGLDIYKHGEAAYPLTAYGHGWDEAAVRPEVKAALRNVSGNVDVVPMEPTNGERTYSLRQNPQHYEHPEHWDRAKDPNIYKRFHSKPNTVAPQ